MATRKQVEGQLGTVAGMSFRSHKPNLDRIAAMFEDGETAENAVESFVSGTRGLLVATDRRLVFAGQAIIKKASETVPYSDITDIRFGQGLRHGVLTVTSRGQVKSFDRISRAKGEAFAGWLRARISSSQPTGPATASAIDQVKQLAELRDQGILTTDEFETKKRELLGL